MDGCEEVFLVTLTGILLSITAPLLNAGSGISEPKVIKVNVTAIYGFHGRTETLEHILPTKSDHNKAIQNHQRRNKAVKLKIVPPKNKYIIAKLMKQVCND